MPEPTAMEIWERTRTDRRIADLQRLVEENYMRGHENIARMYQEILSLTIQCEGYRRENESIKAVLLNVNLNAPLATKYEAIYGDLAFKPKDKP